VAQQITAADQDFVFVADGIDLVRDGRVLLDQVTFAVRPGEHWALLGPNGAGKSTLLRVLATYAHPTRGRVDVFGQQLGRVDVFTLRPLIALVSSHQPVRSARTVRELALTGVTGTTDLPARWTPSTADLRQADLAIELMGLKPLAGTSWPVLSQGERSRALIARALAGRPRVLLLDEPAAGLDLAGREQLLACLDDLRTRQPGLATVLVTHHLEELPASTTHALLLRDGRTLAAGPAADVVTSDLVSTCFGYQVAIGRTAGRWTCVAASNGRAPLPRNLPRGPGGPVARGRRHPGAAPFSRSPFAFAPPSLSEATEAQSNLASIRRSSARVTSSHSAPVTPAR
jgi:iron complex transport system ATP-binding protein